MKTRKICLTRKRWVIAAGILITFLAAATLLQPQERPRPWFNGYKETVESQKLYYHSPYPGQLPALLVRASDGSMKAVWKTDSLPQDFGAEEAVFVFMGGLATAKGSHRFYLAVNGAGPLEFSTSESSARKEWAVRHPQGLELSFRTALVDQFDELFGYFFLKVPRRFLQPGQPLTLELTAEKGGSSDWVMVFEQPLSSWARLKALPALLNTRPPRQPLLLEISNFGPPLAVRVKAGPKVEVRKILETGYNQIYLEVEPVSQPQ
ncbi:MAG TPA: hypothetical protein DCR87_05345, partial [Acidobacteria bacterium]|nr:hypothetical protein [Acidobacteriota bacterium]